METCNNHQQCIDSAIHRAENVCLKHSMHFTPLRRNILELIWQSHIPLKINDISKQLEQNNQAVKPISVYRVLDFLLEYGMIHKLVSQNSFLGCSHPGEKHNCYFIICKKCYKVEEVCTNNLLSDIAQSLNKLNFIPEHITFEVQGICKECHQS